MSTVTDDQRMQNLRRANVVRMHGASTRRAIKLGTIRLADIVGDPLLDNQPVGPFVKSLNRVGDSQSRRALRAAGVSYDRPMRNVSAQTMQAILARLPERHR